MSSRILFMGEKGASRRAKCSSSPLTCWGSKARGFGERGEQAGKLGSWGSKALGFRERGEQGGRVVRAEAGGSEGKGAVWAGGEGCDRAGVEGCHNRERRLWEQGERAAAAEGRMHVVVPPPIPRRRVYRRCNCIGPVWSIFPPNHTHPTTRQPPHPTPLPH
eukprot:scaffold26120_cov79-Isochrysis_galbana.AAC.2